MHIQSLVTLDQDMSEKRRLFQLPLSFIIMVSQFSLRLIEVSPPILSYVAHIMHIIISYYDQILIIMRILMILL